MGEDVVWTWVAHEDKRILAEHWQLMLKETSAAVFPRLLLGSLGMVFHIIRDTFPITFDTIVHIYRRPSTHTEYLDGVPVVIKQVHD